MNKHINYEDWRAEKSKDPEIQIALEELEHAYLVARLRIERRLTQEQLAEIVGSKQASIARLESGRSQPRLSFLRRVIRALGARLELRIIKNEEIEIRESKQVVATTSTTLEEIQREPLEKQKLVQLYDVFYRTYNETQAERVTL